MRILLIICRILVGATFIVSGLVKANDPLGFSYKLQEYFAESALNMPWLEPWALALAILACLGEIVLGFAVLVGGRMKLATWALLLLTLFFGWLTAYTATCDPDATYTVLVNGVSEEHGVTCVTDCGCFGDAMKGSVGRSLTPWESFTKDLILLVFVLPIFFAALRKPGIPFNSTADDRILLPGGLIAVAIWSWVFGSFFYLGFTVIGLAGYLLIKRFLQGPKAEWSTAGWIAAFGGVFIWWCLVHLPWIDYRPYAVGKNIAEQKASGTAPEQNIFMTYRNTKTNETKEFDTKGAYPWDDSTWVYVDRRVEVLKAGVEAPAQDFNLVDVDGNDLTADILGDPTPVLLITAYNVEKAATGCLPAINTLAQDAFKNGWYVYGVSASGWESIDAFRHEHQTPFDFVQCDEKTVKTVVRSNPGVVLLQQGTVRGVWACGDVPVFAEAKEELR
ncbi:MAG: DoxX family membrane protein [Flavobacteriales bacterium]|nr:DoxX family membrane protein [Flavobacteriales bacterium]